MQKIIPPVWRRKNIIKAIMMWGLCCIVVLAMVIVSPAKNIISKCFFK